MKSRLLACMAALAAMVNTCAQAQNVSFIGNGGTGTTTYVSSANPLPTTCISGCSGSGGSTVSLVAATTGGATGSSHAQTAASTNATEVSTGAHTMTVLFVANPTTSLVCLHTYDTGSTPTPGTTTIKHTYTVGAVGTAGQGSGFALPLGPYGEAFTAGIAYSVTGGVSNTCTDADTSSAPLGVSIEIDYK